MAKQPKKKINGYKMPEPLPVGFILEGIDKRKWKLGSSIGKGGFGEIYLAQECTSGRSTSNYPYAMKIEPHENGPLFVEMHCYMRLGKSDDIEAFKKSKELNSLGMPQLIASGSQEYNKQKYRFLVIEKFGTDLWKLFNENDRRFPAATVYKVAIQILDILEYIHSKGYIHGDIKGANVLLGVGKESAQQVYLVDFGLCGRYNTEFKPDPKKAHNGTIEYLSRDAHSGVLSRRGDLEILGYNIVQWLGCKLPWEKDLTNVALVQKSKSKYMDDLPEFFKTCFGSSKVPATVREYFKYIVDLEFKATPDYKKLHNILEKGVISEGSTLKSSLEFKSTKRTTPKRKQSPAPSKTLKKIKKTKSAVSTSEEDTDEETPKVKVNSLKKVSKLQPAAATALSLDDSTAGFTPEMRRIRALRQKKTPKTKVERPARERKVINYKEGSKSDLSGSGDANGSVDIISDSEEEKPIRKHRRK